MSDGVDSVTPSEGERRAISGYEPQYALAAAAALRVAKAGRLSAVRLVDPAADIADDFQLVTAGRIDAHQVKWSTRPGAFTLKTFCELLPGLARGRQQLLAENPSCRIVIHITTNSPASVSDAVPNTEARVGSFHDFWTEVLEPSKRAQSPAASALQKWAGTMKELQTLSGLDADVFNAFIQDLHVDLGTQLPEAKPDVIAAPGFGDSNSDVEAVKAYFLRMIRGSAATTVVELSTQEILLGAGLGDRLELRNRHEFLAPSIPYRPLVSARDQLKALLSSGNKGYLALVGPPGSGKSTLINEEFAAPDLRVLKYFAFVPGGTINSAVRGESENFFHDMNITLVQQGSRGETAFSKTRLEMRAEFLRHLSWLQSDFEVTGRRTVIFIDGLDHICSEQSPERSLLQDLPLPNEIPSGVIVALGTQPAALSELPNAIQQALKLDDRTIELSRLTKEQVGEIVSETFGEQLASFHLLKRIHELCEGHPLALAIMLRAMMDQHQSSSVPLAEALETVGFIGSEIENHYETVWRNAKVDDQVFEFLGMSARDRLPISLDKAEALLGREKTSGMLQTIGHLWQRDPSGRLHVFHNSFGLFLNRITATNLSGQYEESRNTLFHKKLADAYLAESDPVRRWEAVFHLQRAGENEAALKTVTLDFVRQQLQKFRTPDELFGDLRELMKLAMSISDLPKLAELTLAWNELNLCELALGEFQRDFPALLLACGKEQHAIRMLTDGTKLRQSATVCIKIASNLLKSGFHSESKRLFLAAEPLHALHSLTHVNQHEEIKGLVAWARNAPMFRRPEQVHHFITDASLHGFQDSREQTSEQLRNQLLTELVTGLTERQIQSAVIDEVDAHLRECDRRAWLVLRSERLNALLKNEERRNLLADDTVSAYVAMSPAAPETWETLLVAEVACFLVADQDTSKRLVNSIHKFSCNDFGRFGDLSESHRYSFRLCRLRASLGLRDISADIDANDENSYRRVDQQVTQHIAHLGTVVGQRRTDQLPREELLREIRISFRFLSQRTGSTFSNDDFASARAVRPAVMQLLLDGLANDDAFGHVVDMFVEMLNGLATGERWTLKEREEGLRVLCASAAQSNVKYSVLRQLEADWPTDAPTTSEVAEREFALANAKSRLEDAVGCFSHLQAMLAQLGTVDHDKDDQYQQWCEFLSLASIIDLDSASRQRRLKLMVKAAVAAKEASCPSEGAAIVAIKNATLSNPAEGKTLVDELSEIGAVSFADGLGAFLSACVQKDETVSSMAIVLTQAVLIPIAEPVEDCVRGVTLGIESAELFEQLASDVDIHGLSEHRWQWRKQIIKAAQTYGLALPARSSDAAGENPGAFNDSMKVSFDGETEITVAEALKLVESPADFRRLRRMTPGSYRITTEALTAQLCRDFQEADVLALAQVILSYDERGRETALCMDRLNELGNSEEANRLARHILNQCGSGAGEHDWLWDGALLRAMKQLEGHTSETEFRQLTLDALARYISSDQKYLHRTGADLFGEILPRICTKEEILRIADNVEDFVGHATRFVQTIDTSQLPAMSARVAILEIVAELLPHPVTFLAEASRITIARLLQEGSLSDSDVAKLCSLADREPNSIDGMLAALFVVAEQSPSSVRGATPWLQMVSTSMSLGARAEATMILKAIGEPLPTKTLQNANLMSNFLSEPIVLIPGIVEENPTSTGYLKDTFDADTLTIAFEPHISCLAEAAGMERKAVLRRVYDICVANGRENWSEAAERALRGRLENAQLKLTFQRLRSRVVGAAIHQAAAELVDAGRLKTEGARSLLSIIRTSDPALLQIAPVQPPLEVPRFVHPDPFGGDKEDWRAECENGVASIKELICREVDDIFVISEFSTFTAGRNGGYEVRSSNVWIGEQMPDDEKPTIPIDLTSYATRYFQACAEEPAIAVRHHTMMEQHGSHANWLTLNSNAAVELGFEPNNERLFGWDDGENYIWVLRWLSGSPLVSPHEGICADGWLLLGSNGVKARLQERFGRIRRRCRVTRSFEEDYDSRISGMNWSEDI